VQVVRYNTATDFLERAKAWLETAEAENNLILGISKYFQSDPQRPAPILLTIEDGDRISGAALMTAPRNSIISRMPQSALVALADYYLENKVLLPGVVGPKDTVRAFADYWKKRTGKGSRIKMRQRLYACERVLIQVKSRGYFRPATEKNKSLATQWAAEFCREAGIEDEVESMTTRIPHLIAIKSLYVWDDDQMASVALVQRDTSHGIAISMVYTPAHLRRHGYATSCVAALTQRMLDTGKQFCCLYTDLTNPTSNSIYQTIGYEPVCDSEDLVFE
jgi:predicted GNAT family acetyltransferase